MRKAAQSWRRGFTLVELTVVLTLIALVATIAMPMVTKLLDANSYTQAYYLMSGQLRAARSTALMTDTYIAIHHQKITADNEANEGLEDRFFLAIMNQSYGGQARHFKELIDFRLIVK